MMMGGLYGLLPLALAAALAPSGVGAPRIPLVFEQNLGQFRTGIQFVAGPAAFRSSDVVLALGSGLTTRMRFMQANRSVTITGTDRRASHSAAMLRQHSHAERT